MNFGQALDQMRAGRPVTRTGWNGVGMWICISPGKPDCPAAELWAPLNQLYAKDHGGSVSVRPYITMKTAQGDIVPWVASQTDLLAVDWSTASWEVA